MSASTFTPGDHEHTTETITDIDGEIYPGETIKLKKSMSFFGAEPELEGDTPQETKLYLYGVTPAEQEDAGEVLRLIVVDRMGHDAEIDAVPYQLGKLGEWLIREAQKSQAGEAR